MPRTTTVECPGCPPLRALTFDSLGLIKVVEHRGEQRGIPKVVDRWGDPDFSKSVIATSIVHRKCNPLLAVARKNGQIEILNPQNGHLQVAMSDSNHTEDLPKDDAVAGLHLFTKEIFESASRSFTLLTCKAKGNASVRSLEVSNSSASAANIGSSKTWNVCASGTITCSKVDGSETYALFGGKGVEVNVWDLDSCTKIWAAKSPPKNSLGIFTPTWFTSATFLSKDDHRKFVAGTNSHQVRLYDLTAQRRPVISFDFKETPIKALVEDIDGRTIFLGTGSGDLASVDMRTGKLLGSFIGKCSGSIRSIARHPDLPVIASCGLDSFVRFWDINSRQLLSSVFLKQHLSSVVFDSNFSNEVSSNSAAAELIETGSELLTQTVEEGRQLSTKRKKAADETKRSKRRTKEDKPVKGRSKTKTSSTKTQRSRKAKSEKTYIGEDQNPTTAGANCDSD